MHIIRQLTNCLIEKCSDGDAVLVVLQTQKLLSVCVNQCFHTATTMHHVIRLENVSIANALQLEAARRRAVPLRFNFVTRVKFELAQPIPCSLRAFFMLIRYVTL